MTTTAILIPFILYIIVVNLISYLARRRQAGEDEYAMGGRRFTGVYVAFGLFTLIGAGEITAMPALGTTLGWSAISLFVGYAVSFTFLAACASTVRANVGEDRPLSLPDFIRKRFGNSVFYVVLAITVLALFTLLALQFAVLGLLAPTFVVWPPELVIAVCALAALSYLYVGGYRAVMLTDLVQGLAMLVLLPLILVVVLLRSAEIDVSKLTLLVNPGWTHWVGVLISGFFGGMVGADVWQRIYSARSVSEARKGLLWGAGLFLFYGLLLTAIGVLANATGYTGSPDAALAHFVTNVAPVWASPLVVLLLLCIILSTADTEMFLIGTMLNRLFAGAEKNRTGATVLGARIWITLVTAAAALVGATTTGYLAMYGWLLSIGLMLAPIVLGVLFTDVDKRIVMGALIANIGAFIGLASTGQVSIDNAYLVALPTVLLAIGLIAWKRLAAPRA